MGELQGFLQTSYHKKGGQESLTGILRRAGEKGVPKLNSTNYPFNSELKLLYFLLSIFLNSFGKDIIEKGV